jgi:hypothetical protein
MPTAALTLTRPAVVDDATTALPFDEDSIVKTPPPDFERSRFTATPLDVLVSVTAVPLATGATFAVRPEMFSVLVVVSM